MRLLPVLSIFLLAASLISCGGPATDREQTDRTAVDSLPLVDAPPPPCPVRGEMLPGNWFQVREQNLMLAVIADSTTFSPDYGPGHRVLALYELPSCREVERHVLPVNISPDIPYQIASITYNHQSELVGISGFDVVYGYDVAGRALLPPMKPSFKNKRSGVDAQSGRIERLEVWEHYLVGYARDYGAFVFDLQDKSQPRLVIPLAEFKRPDSEEYNSAFLLPSGTECQVLAPAYYPETDEFDINPLLPQLEPVDLRTAVPVNGNRYLLLPPARGIGVTFVVDLAQRRLLDLPPALQKAGRPEITAWLNQQF